MWRTLGLLDVDGLRQWLSVVDGSAPWCGGQSIEDLQVSIQRNRGQVFLYTGAGFQIAIRFEFDPTRERWQMASTGFVGNTTPAAALDLIVARFAQFLADQNASSIFCVVQKQAPSPTMSDYYQRIPQHPDLLVTVHRETDTAWLWEVEYAGP